MHGLAQQWADKMPSLDDAAPAPGANSTPAFGSTSPPPPPAAALSFTHEGESGVRARRVAQDRGRYKGFDDGMFKDQRHSTAAATAAAGGRFSRTPVGGSGGYSGRGGFAGGSGGGGGGGGGERFLRERPTREPAGWAEEHAGGGSSGPSGGWVDRYKTDK